MFRFLVAALLLVLPAPAQVATPAERKVVEEMSRVRLSPKEMAHWLQAQLPYFEGTLWRLPGRIPLRTEEGPAAVEELIAVLDKTPSIGPLHWSEGLSRAARALVEEQGPTGGTGHVGPTGSTMRSRTLRVGLYQSRLGEVIDYGREEARWIVVQLLIDDGVPSRAHRQVILDPAFHFAGAATGPHAKYEEMTVVDLADGFQENP